MELCLKWVSLPGIIDSIEEFIDSDFILLLFENLSDEVELVDQLVNALPASKLPEVYNQVIFKLKSVSSISYLLPRAIEIDPSSRYRLVEISLQFFFVLDAMEQSRLVHLISSPLLIIEQLLMNTKIDALERVLEKVCI